MRELYTNIYILIHFFRENVLSSFVLVFDCVFFCVGGFMCVMMCACGVVFSYDFGVILYINVLVCNVLLY